MRITLTVGISNSGKTTWANQQLEAVNINRDDLRALHHTKSGNIKDHKFTKSKETNITNLQFKMAEHAWQNSKDIIISDTNLNPKTLKKWFDWAEERNIPLEIKEFDIEPHIAKARNIKREYSVPPSVIDKQYQAWRKYKGMPQVAENSKLPDAVIFDMDGTLADMTGIRSPFEWDKVDQDNYRPNVCSLADVLNTQGIKVIIMSGRDGVAFEKTKYWLDKYAIPYEALFMREAGDSRPDAVVKEELYWKHVAPNYNVKFVVDDRDQMVARWRAMGLECWQVQAGDF